MLGKQGKKKQSIDFTDYTFALLDNYANETGKSKSAIVNDFVTMLLDVPDHMRADLLHLFAKERNNYCTAGLNGAQFAAAEYDRSLRICQMYIDLLSRGGFVKPGVPMKTVPMPDGYAYVPEDWIVLNNIPFERRRFAFVIEVSPGDKYGLPHFLYFAETENISTPYTKDIERLCGEIYPKFLEVKSREVKPDYREGLGVINAEEYLASPRIGHFLISEKGTSSSYPCGAMVIKDTLASDNTGTNNRYNA